MKKSLYVVFILLTIFPAGYAQQFSFGIKGGINANNFVLRQKSNGVESKIVMPKTGFHAGGIIDILFGEHFSVQPQVLFVMKGGKFNQNGTRMNFSFYTIDLPINLLYRHDDFFIGAGPDLSYGVSANAKQTGYDQINIYKEFAGGKFKRFDIGVNVLMGYRFSNNILVSANYTPGLSDIVDENGSSLATVAHNSFFGFSIGYMFGINK